MSTIHEPSLNQSSAQRANRSNSSAARVSDAGTILPQLPVKELQGCAFRRDELGVRRRHAAFHRFGRRLEGNEPPPAPYTSVHAWVSRTSSMCQDGFPCCLLADDTQPFAMPLRRLVHEAVEGLSTEMVDSSSRAKLTEMLESELRAALSDQPDESWDTLVNLAIDRAAASTFQDGAQPAPDEEQLRRIAERLGNVTSVLECTSTAPRALFIAAARSTWRKRCRRLAEELAGLVSDLKRLVRTDERESAEVHDPGRLRSAFGTEEIDAKAMADIIETGHLAHEITESRRARLMETLSALDEFQWMWSTDGDAPDSFPELTILATCQDAMDAIRTQRSKWTAFFRAVWIARLEVKNEYSEHVHDELFAKFSWQSLNEDERAVLPPVLLSLDDDALRGEPFETLIELMQSDSPVKVLAEVRSPFSGARHLHPSAAAVLSVSTVVTGAVYVLQAPIDRVDVLTKHLPEALDYPGASLISIYEGADDLRPDDRSAHTSAAACARVWPLVVSDPRIAHSNSDNFDANPNAQSDWAVTRFDPGDEDKPLPLSDFPFTVAHHMLDQLALEANFMAIPPEEWHDGLCPIHRYLELDEAETETYIPVIWAVDAEDRLVQVIVRQDVVDATRRWRDVWRNVQRLNGAFDRVPAVGSDRANQLESVPRHDERQAVPETLVNEATRAAVSRIAAWLVGVQGDGSEPIISGSALLDALPVSSSEVAEIATPDDVSESTEAGPSATGEAYIDTPLCTSCDECTRLNDRIFAYNENKQAYIKDAAAGLYRDLVTAAEKCPVHIIHPGKPLNPNEPGLAKLLKRAEKYR